MKRFFTYLLLITASLWATATSSVQGNWYTTDKYGRWACSVTDSLLIANNRIYRITAATAKGKTQTLALTDRLSGKKTSAAISAAGRNKIKLRMADGKSQTLTCTEPTRRTLPKDKGYGDDFLRSDTTVVYVFLDGYTPAAGCFDVAGTRRENIFTGEDRTQTYPIGDDGCFTAKVAMDCPEMLWFCVSFDANVDIMTYAEPGDTIAIYANVNGQREYMGRNAELTAAFLEAKKCFSNYEYMDFYHASQTMTPSEYKASVTPLMDQWAVKADSLARTRYAASAKLGHWLRNEAKVEKALWLMEFTMNTYNEIWQAATSNGEYQPEIAGPDYYDFLADTPLNDPTILASAQISQFLNRYQYAQFVYAVQYMREKSGAYTILAGTAEEMAEMERNADQMMDSVSQMKNPFLWQVARSNSFCHSIAEASQSIRDRAYRDADSIKSLTAYPIICENIDRYVAQKFAVGPMGTYQLPESDAAATFRRIIAEHPGKLLYVDFWSTGCGPCIAQIKNTQALRDSLRGAPDVEFVFITSERDSPEKRYETFCQGQLRGEASYRLTMGEYMQLEELFGFNAIPHTEIVMPDGSILHHAEYQAMGIEELLQKYRQPQN